MEELWEWDIDTSNLNAILDPLTINTNIISNDDNDDIDKFIESDVNKVIIKSSSLNIIRMIFFRHQHILVILMVIIIFVIFRFSTSKVDILYKLFRTFGNYNYCNEIIIY